ncbi:tripartite tricarboxylate transporter TctB family protein [Ahrensia sp. 13_GOM-1096m]|uniref:tripartite tricarboxylate transporter TctB family protein n=1 Tax=Ahrensia sp. 13_GOM-1096m TaxID=1380380 RepID=UPI00054D03DF|nr:tripartite tricarboxylate transporter TctB family protein [Ahrensia sp. 13_GOM-1096m]
MADRIFASLLLISAITYSFIAFTLIKAPFQYDPLGPETWPRILSVLAIFCCAYVIYKPDVWDLHVERKTWIRLAGLVVMLSAYAWLFQPAGFVIATFLFCAALSVMLGANIKASLIFAVVTGVLGYVIGTILLDLNLPAGLLAFLE